MRTRGLPTLAVLACAVLTLSACGAAGSIGEDPILEMSIPGAVETSMDTSGDTVTRLFDVTGRWPQVSIDLAVAVQGEGWQVEALNCVGSGNDVIAKKMVEGEWFLLESGAGARGAGIIVRPDPDNQGPDDLMVTGSCASSLISSITTR